MLSILILIVIGFVIVGWIVIKSGFDGVRKGSAPHCPKCDYNLTGLPALRCPECGLELSERTVVFGERKRKNLHVILGCLSFFIAAFCLYLTYLEIEFKLQNEWYQYRPTFMLLNDLKVNRLSDRPVEELLRRFKENRLTDKQISAIVRATLPVIVSMRQAKRYQLAFRDLLATLLHAGFLTPPQTETYFRNIEFAQYYYLPNWYKTSHIREGKGWLMCTLEGKFSGWMPRRIVEVISIDDRKVNQIVMDYYQFSKSFSGRLSKPLISPANKKVTIRVTTEWYDFGPNFSREHFGGLSSSKRRAWLKEFMNMQPPKKICAYVDVLVFNEDNDWMGILGEQLNTTTAPTQ
ncbi:MAG: hypothetical protein JSV03_00325 [Planctomycetota bacterium]|nr:MAG: hypothetical protein JSV03_00325 [Planctomycetota bacterium]